jgi:hypothetical protein
VVETGLATEVAVGASIDRYWAGIHSRACQRMHLRKAIRFSGGSARPDDATHFQRLRAIRQTGVIAWVIAMSAGLVSPNRRLGST